MGAGMAARLLVAGHALSVYNRTPARAEPLARLGAKVAASARAAAEKADIIIGMTADDDSSRAMWLGDLGALAASNAPDALVIECSTLSHDWVLELAREVRRRGFRYVDAPVTGLPDAAAAGTLTLLVGADPGDLDAARPVFASLATRVLHFGAGRTGHGLQAHGESHGRGTDRLGRRGHGAGGIRRTGPETGRGRHRQRPGGKPAGGAQRAPFRERRSHRRR